MYKLSFVSIKTKMYLTSVFFKMIYNKHTKLETSYRATEQLYLFIIEIYIIH